MKINKLDIALIPALYQLLKDKNVSKAAKHLFITQSAASKILAKLRDSFKDPLLIQSGSYYELSIKGQSLFAELETLVPAIERLWLPNSLNIAQEQRTITIAGTDLDMLAISAQLTKVMAQATNCKFSVSSSHEDSLDDVIDGKIDILLSAFKSDSPTLDKTPAFKSDYVCLLNSGDKPVSVTAGPLTLDEYLGVPHISFQLSSMQKSAVDICLQAQNVTRNITLWTSTFHHAINMLVHSRSALAVTLIRKIIDTIGIEDSLQVHELPFEIPPLQVYAYLHKKTLHDPFLQWLKEQLIS